MKDKQCSIITLLVTTNGSRKIADGQIVDNKWFTTKMQEAF